MASLNTERVLQSNDIVEYLSLQGYEPVFATENKFKYTCPLPEHDDSSPSFYVYKNEEGRPPHFHCYGCQTTGNIITLVMKMEGLSFPEAMKKLGKGMEFTSEDELNHVLRQLAKSCKEKEGDPIGFDVVSADDMGFTLSRSLYFFLRAVKFSEPFLTETERIFALLDDYVKANDLINLQQLELELDTRLSEQRVRYEQMLEDQTRELAKIYGEK